MIILWQLINGQKIYSLEENLICEITPCDKEILQYVYGQETFGDLTTIPFTLSCIQKNNQTFQIVFYHPNGQSTSFIASIQEGGISIVNLEQSTNYSFTISNTDTKISQWFNLNVRYQIIITEQIIQVCNHLACFSTNHNKTITQNTKFNILNSTSTQYNYIKACCIIMYKGITYPNNNQITFYNTKYPEVVVNLNIQEKIQSNITVDYSDYSYIAKLGDIFEYDQYDPYLVDDSLLLNGSQYIQINLITLNDQYSFEFRFQLSVTATSQIILLNYDFPQTNTQMYIFLNGTQITYKLNNQYIQFQLLTSNNIHFCLGITQYLEQSANLQQIYFIQFSDNQTLQILKYNISGFFNVNPAYGYMYIGSKTNQFQSGEYLSLFIFRYYQGFFYDDQQVMGSNCKFNLNDRCIICNSGYVLQNDHSCLLQSLLCDKTNYDTQLVASHNQCIRKCHQKCATCSLADHKVCLTCNSIRTNPPDCICPNQYFEDQVSPKCRKYYPDVTVQTGTVVGYCGTLPTNGISYGITLTVNYLQIYKTTPKVVVSLVGQSFNYDTYYTIYSINEQYFQIGFSCNFNYQSYIFNWISSIGDNIVSQPYFSNIYISGNMNCVLNQSNILYNGLTINPIYQINGFSFPFNQANTKYQIKQQVISPTQIQILSEIQYFTNSIFYYYFYTQYKTYSISSSSFDAQLDSVPKSIRHFIVQRGFYVDSNSIYRYINSIRTSTYFKMKEKYHQSVQIYDWLLIFAQQQCNNSTGPCDFYDSYISNCTLQFQFCAYKPETSNYFINSTFNYQLCDANCKSCFGLSTNCTSCYTDYYTLPKNQLSYTKFCSQNCDRTCLTCSTTNNVLCLSCGQFATLISTQCKCNSGYYFDNIDTNQCQKCSKKCETCKNDDKDYCLSCNQYLDSNGNCQDCNELCNTCNGPLENQCLSCNSVRYLNEQNQCQCNRGYYSINNACLKCSYYCQECDQETSCLTCPLNRQLDELNICVCSLGYYNKENQQSCEQCPKNCEQCVNFFLCLKCKINLDLISGQCFCSQGFFYESGLCLSCDSPFGKFQKSCNYKNCNDNIWTPAEECDDGNKISNDGCTNCIIDKNYQCFNKIKQPSICYQCQNNCQSCNYYQNIIQCNFCNQGYYLQNNYCLKCDQYCKTCSSFSLCVSCKYGNKEPDEFKKCPRCDQGFQIDQCVTQCGDGIKTDDEQCDDGNINSLDGCSNKCEIEDSYACFLVQRQSYCFLSDKPKLKINKIIKLTQSQYVINIISTQEIKYKELDVLVGLQGENSYNFSYNVYITRNKSKFSYLQMNITIIFSVSLKQELFLIQINGDISNEYNQTISQTQLDQEFTNIYILSELEQKFSDQGSDIANKLFYFTLVLTVLQMILSGTSSFSLMLRTQNYLQYMRFIKIDFPPNIVILFSQFADSNILQYLDINFILNGLFGVGFSSTLKLSITNYEINNYQVNTSFILNIMPFILTFVQSLLIIKLTQFIVYLVNQNILYRHQGQNSFLMKIYKILSYCQFYALKSIYEFKQTGIKEILLISQYIISFAFFLKLKTFDYNSYYDCAEIIITLGVSYFSVQHLIDCSKNQQAEITQLRLVNGIQYIFYIVFLQDLQLEQMLLISIQSIMMLILLFQKNTLQDLPSIVEELSFLLTYLSSILYIYSPIDINYIQIGFFQFGAIQLSIFYKMQHNYGLYIKNSRTYLIEKKWISPQKLQSAIIKQKQQIYHLYDYQIYILIQ